jgi:colanic acid biosynthesis protein WcaH
MIPAEQYARIIAVMPILCVDLVLTDSRGRYLLAKRTNEPLKGEWWVIGGRVQLGETAEAAARRKLQQELGIAVGKLELLGLYEDFFEHNSLGAEQLYHTASMVFGATIDDSTSITLDEQHDSWSFAEALPARLVIQPFAGLSSSMSPRATAQPHSDFGNTA